MPPQSKAKAKKKKRVSHIVSSDPSQRKPLKSITITDEDEEKATRELKDANPALSNGFLSVTKEARGILKALRENRPYDVSSTEYSHVDAFWNQFGVQHLSIAGEEEACSVCELSWSARVAWLSYQSRRRGERLEVLTDSNTIKFRQMLHPDVYYKNQKSKDQIRQWEIMAWRYLLSGKEMEKRYSTTVGNVPRGLDRWLAKDYNDIFYWLHYGHNLFKRYPLKKRFELVNETSVSKMTQFLNQRLQAKSGPAFENKVKSAIIDQHLPLGATTRYEARNPNSGSHFTNLEVLNASYTNADITNIQHQTNIPVNKIGTSEHDMMMSPGTEDMWRLHAWATYIASKCPGIDFIGEYCVLWDKLGTADGEALLSLKKRQDIRPRLPILMNIGYVGWFVHDNGCIVQGAEPPTLVSALCLCDSLVKSNYGGRFENSRTFPDFTKDRSLLNEVQTLLKVSKQLSTFGKATAFSIVRLPEAVDGDVLFTEAKLPAPPTNTSAAYRKPIKGVDYSTDDEEKERSKGGSTDVKGMPPAGKQKSVSAAGIAAPVPMSDGPKEGTRTAAFASAAAPATPSVPMESKQRKDDVGAVASTTIRKSWTATPTPIASASREDRMNLLRTKLPLSLPKH